MDYWLIMILLVSTWVMYVTWLAARLRRLHARVDAASRALDAALVRRALGVAELAVTQPIALGSRAGATELAAHGALCALAEDREGAESELTRAVQDVLEFRALQSGALDPSELESRFTEVLAQNRSVETARALYNDAVRDTCALRRRRHVRTLRLAVHRRRPTYFDIDATLTTALPQSSTTATPAAGPRS
ncbi:MAG: hypothetical protein DLM55_12370 [Acidimicrobiales bacterium]|nr:MAG: hypothetical protein DLM55_12370 [Acidimicrobiales bacterium]